MAERTKEPPGEMRPPGGWGHEGEVAIRKAKIAGWLPHRWERIGDDDSLYTGCVPATSKNGKPKWPKPWTQVVTTQAEREAEERAYEDRHGRCHHCFGRGEEWSGWNRDTGDKYRRCSVCGGSGRPIPIPPPKEQPE